MFGCTWAALEREGRFLSLEHSHQGMWHVHVHILMQLQAWSLSLTLTLMSDYDFRPGGSLKLKGGVAEGGVVKK